MPKHVKGNRRVVRSDGKRFQKGGCSEDCGEVNDSETDSTKNRDDSMLLDDDDEANCIKKSKHEKSMSIMVAVSLKPFSR